MPGRIHVHDARARLLVRRFTAVPVPLLAPLVAVPHAAAQLATPASVGFAAGDAGTKLHELLGDGGVVRVVNFALFEHLLRHSKVLLESTPPVEKAKGEVMEGVLSFMFGKWSRNEALHGVFAQLQPGAFRGYEESPSFILS